MTTFSSNAIVFHEHGGAEVLKWEPRELPAPAKGEVQLRHTAIGVNFIDIYDRSGLYPRPLPEIPGREAAGVVTAIGRGVRGLKVGQRVAYVIGAAGAYAEHRNIAADRLVKLPTAISDEQAAALMLKGLTAEYLLRRTFKVREGQTVLIHAGAGGVGQLLCGWARALGATVIATAGSREKAEIARKAGAAYVILYRDEDFAARVREITNGRLCEVVYDGVGAATFPASLDCLAPFGMFVSFGSASGPIKAFDLGLLAQKGSLYATRPSLFTHIADRRVYEEMTAEVVDAVRRRFISLDKPQRFALADAAKVHAALESRQTSGSIVLTP